ncbi:iron complex transport system substrate-binding protein [Halolactibacillus halophilus]|uniref:ABC transporter solute-binding protein YclQ n=1 Tax=Halolactibacillus halophilus TaxID=306540 RepID=A0A1I5RA65_9BACI|nr:siderophore ABC transporter substrate-binding protein [Halolactibacillus halophilus]GEM02292.1 putative ABC transporter solute-binding protein YclQ [Halolactibacillus halophilus]SFP55290.1 iron complex transport system substrate-binding protein [Halolactibacillus halophilus]
MKKLMLLMFALIASLVLVACQENATDESSNTDSKNEEQQDNETNEDTDAPTEITVAHELGETTVPVNPETVAVFDFGTLDTLDNLGIEVAALPLANVPDYLDAYATDDYTNAGTLFEPDFEALANLDPDLIIISGRTQEAYDDLSELAPTVYVTMDNADYLGSFEQNVTLMGEIFSKQTEAAEVVEKVKEEAAAVKDMASEDKSGLIILTSDGSVTAYGPGSRFGLIHDVLGVTAVDETIESVTHGQSISFEYIAEKNPDLLYVLDRNAVTGGDYTAETTLDNDLVNVTTAATEGNITYLTPDYWYLSSGGITSVTQMIEEIKQSFE